MKVMDGFDKWCFPQYGHLWKRTNELSLVTTYSWDNLDRLISVVYPDGSYTSNRYQLYSGTNATGGTGLLDVTGTKDRLGYWTLYEYDRLRRISRVTDAKSRVTQYSYCGCGVPEDVTDALGGVTHSEYDLRGNKVLFAYPDDTFVQYYYDSAGRLFYQNDNLTCRTNGYNHQGLLTVVSNRYGAEQRIAYDVYDRPYVETDANGVSVTNQYDLLGRLVKRMLPNGTNETFAYSSMGLTTNVNALGQTTQYRYDALGRMTNEITGKTESLSFTYDPAGNLLTMRDGRTNQTSWAYMTSMAG